jgi:protein-tyrosine phosphatase
MSLDAEIIPGPDGDPRQSYFDEVGPLRALRIDGVLNARDVGGLAGPEGGVRTGRLLRTACLGALTPEGAKALAGLGLRTVIDLRTPLERELQPNLVAGTAGLENVGEIHVELLKTLAELDELPPGDSKDLYRYLADACAPGFVAVLEHLARPGTLPALVHCQVGKDRTGLLVALLLGLLDVPREAIYADYIASNAGLGSLAHTDVHAEVLAWTLEGLDERYGSPRGYLDAHGLRPETVETLRAALLEEVPLG